MKISGSSKIPSGEYEGISASGSTRLFGLIKCTSFSTSGRLRGEDIECSEDFKSSGRVSLNSINAKNIKASGTFLCSGDISASVKIRCTGKFKCNGAVEASFFQTTGSARIGKDIKAQKLESKGALDSDGAIIANEISVCANLSAKSLIGGKISVSVNKTRKPFKKLRILRNARIDSCIEGDEISVEYITCPKVTGRVVKIGDGCEIDTVEYSESIELSKRAKIGKLEKITKEA